jgi:hypothetical protein
MSGAALATSSTAITPGGGLPTTKSSSSTTTTTTTQSAPSAPVLVGKVRKRSASLLLLTNPLSGLDKNSQARRFAVLVRTPRRQETSVALSWDLVSFCFSRKTNSPPTTVAEHDKCVELINKHKQCLREDGFDV